MDALPTHVRNDLFETEFTPFIDLPGFFPGAGELESVATLHNLRKIIVQAKLPLGDCFLTNAVLWKGDLPHVMWHPDPVDLPSIVLAQMSKEFPSSGNRASIRMEIGSIAPSMCEVTSAMKSYTDTRLTAWVSWI